MIQTICSSLYNALPKNEHAQTAENLKQQIKQLKSEINNTEGSVFQETVRTVILELKEKKRRLVKDLSYLNGSYYEDPISILKQKWDIFITQPEGGSLQESSATAYLEAEIQKDQFEEQLVKVISSLKTHNFPLLKTEEEEINEEEMKLRLRLKELCGNHYEDSSSLLDRAWKVYQSALQCNTPGKEILYNRYSTLERERRTIETQLYRLEQQKAIPANFNDSIYLHADRKLNHSLDTLSKQLNQEESLAGIDWMKLGKMALGTAGAANMSCFCASYPDSSLN